MYSARGTAQNKKLLLQYSTVTQHAFPLHGTVSSIIANVARH